MSAYVILYVVFAITCGILTYGMNFAYVQRQWPIIAKSNYREDIGICMIFGILVAIIPFLFIVSFGLTGFAKHGLKFK